MSQIMRLLVGLPGSGKSTYAKELDPAKWRRINWDEQRKLTAGYRPGHFSRKIEDVMKQTSYDIAFADFKLGFNLVIDNTNLSAKSRYKWAELAAAWGMEVEIYVMPDGVEECVRRDRLRTGTDRVGRAVIERMALWNDMINFGDSKFVLVDMDGTLSDSSERLKYVSGKCNFCTGKGGGWLAGSGNQKCYMCDGTGKAKKDWDSFFGKAGEDKTNPFVENLVRTLHAAGFKILIVSGRPIDKAGILTEDWLYAKNIPFHHLFMRQGFDKRDDTIVKQEILNKLPNPKERVIMAIDDRPSVIRMWRDNGINVLDVGFGKEF